MDGDSTYVGLVYRFHRINRYIMDNAIPKVDLRKSEVSLLMMIWHKSNINGQLMNVKTIAQSLGIKSGTVSPIIYGLEKQGYLERVSQENDRRFFYFKVTAQAQKVLTEIQAEVAEELKKILEPLTSEEQSVLIDLINKINENIEDEY